MTTRELKNACAQNLDSHYCSDDIVATAGATQGLHIITHLLFSAGDIVFVENTTYFVATKIFQSDGGLNMKSGEIVVCCLGTSCSTFH